MRYDERMTDADTKPRPLPEVEERDLLTLAVDLGDGYFPSSDLYAWYVALVGQTGRNPVSKKAFGTALRAAGWASSVRYIGGKNARCWLITKSWVRRGEAARL